MLHLGFNTVLNFKWLWPNRLNAEMTFANVKYLKSKNIHRHQQGSARAIIITWFPVSTFIVVCKASTNEPAAVDSSRISERNSKLVKACTEPHKSARRYHTLQNRQTSLQMCKQYAFVT